MKLLYFDDFRLGVLRGEAVFDVPDRGGGGADTAAPDPIANLIGRVDDYRGRLEAASQSGGVPLQQVRIRPPLPKPATIVCMAVNYMEDGTRSEPAPINAFLKSGHTVIGNG